MTEINIYNSTISNTQLGGKNNTLIISKADQEWEEVEKIWDKALERVDDNVKKRFLLQEASELTKKKDKNKLKELVHSFWNEFTKDILSGAAAEIVLNFLAK